MHPKILINIALWATFIELEKGIVVYIPRLPELERTENALKAGNEFEEAKREWEEDLTIDDHIMVNWISIDDDPIHKCAVLVFGWYWTHEFAVESILLSVELGFLTVKNATAWVFGQRKAKSVLRSLSEEENMVALFLVPADEEERHGSGRFEKLIWCTAEQSEGTGWSSTMCRHNVRPKFYATWGSCCKLLLKMLRSGAE
jgi:hypothetical protein